MTMKRKKWKSKRLIFHDDDWKDVQIAGKIARLMLDKPYYKIETCIGMMAREFIGTYGGEYDVSNLQESDFTVGSIDAQDQDNVNES